MPVLLDTSVAIDLRDDEPATVERVARLTDMPLLSIVSRVELENGIGRTSAEPTLRYMALDLMLRTFEVLHFGTDEGDAYRMIVERTGFSRPRILDRMIAATALVHGLTLVTRNPRDFADIDGLAIESW